MPTTDIQLRIRLQAEREAFTAWFRMRKNGATTLPFTDWRLAWRRLLQVDADRQRKAVAYAIACRKDGA